MRKIINLIWVAAVSSILLTACSGGGSGLIIIPDQVKKAKVNTDNYKDVHAVFLYDVGFADFDPMDVGHSKYPTYQFSEFVKIKLLTRAATEGGMFGNRTIRHLGELKELEAWVIKPDGKKKKLGPSDVKTSILVKDVIPGAVPPINMYETAIIFPGLDAGDVIEYHYTRRGRDTNWTFSKQQAPVLFSKFMVARPMRRIEIQPLIYERNGLKVIKSEDRGIVSGMTGRVGSRRATYDIWEASNVAPIKKEPSMPPLVDLAARLRVWQGDRRLDWSTLGGTYYKWFTHYDRSVSGMKELLAKVLDGVGSDPMARARAIHDWVKANMNLMDHDQLSWVPREIEIDTIDLDKLLKEKEATPERTANLMWALMKAAGVETSLVLATSAWDADAEEGLPDLYQFTYPLLALPDGTLIDTTSRWCPFGHVPWYFEGRKSLWIKGDTISFKKLPVSPPSENKVARTIRAAVDTDGNATIKVTATYTGQRAFVMREYYGPKTPKEREVKMQEMVSDTVAKAELGEYVFNNLQDNYKPLQLVFDFKVPGYSQVLRDKMIVKLGAFVNLTSSPEFPAEHRQYPVWFRYKWQEDMDIQIDMPMGFSLKALPKGFRTRHFDSNTALGAQTSYGSPDGQDLHVIRKLSVNEVFVETSGYKALRNLIQRYLAQKDTLVTLRLPKMD